MQTQPFGFFHVSATFLIEKRAYFTNMVGTLILVLKHFHCLQANLKTKSKFIIFTLQLIDFILPTEVSQAIRRVVFCKNAKNHTPYIWARNAIICDSCHSNYPFNQFVVQTFATKEIASTNICTELQHLVMASHNKKYKICISLNCTVYWPASNCVLTWQHELLTSIISSSKGKQTGNVCSH